MANENKLPFDPNDIVTALFIQSDPNSKVIIGTLDRKKWEASGPTADMQHLYEESIKTLTYSSYHHDRRVIHNVKYITNVSLFTNPFGGSSAIMLEIENGDRAIIAFETDENYIQQAYERLRNYVDSRSPLRDKEQ